MAAGRGLLILLALSGGGLLAADAAPARTVRVAALQCWSPMGQVAANRQQLTDLVTAAAKAGAKIVVTPECALQGYFEPATDTAWTADAAAKGYRPVAAFAEAVPGPATEHFGKLAATLGVYLCLGLIERADDKFYNAQVLFSPTGDVLAHHRKTVWWLPGDRAAFTRSDEPVQVVATEYGRLGLMICYEVHTLPAMLAKAEADLVLYSVAWYGGNAKNWFKNTLPQREVAPNGFALIAANWCAPNAKAAWDGAGYSMICDRTGKVLAQVDSASQTQVLLADLPLNPPAK